MYRISIRDGDGRDVTRESEWLPVGRESQTSLRTPHTLLLCEGDAELASVRVRSSADAANSVLIDAIHAPVRLSPEHLAALTYCALREARIVGRSVAEIEPGEHRAALCEILKAPGEAMVGRVCQRVDYGMHQAFATLGSELQASIADTFPSEVVRTVEHFMDGFYRRGIWAQAVRHGVLTRRQYTAFLFNLHSYVRYTTRLLGHCIGLSNPRRLRGHYIEHFKGEMNHEVIIERDLGALGEDADYVTNHHQPSAAALGFMAIQESIVGFQHDPVLFLACPIAAEGFAAYLCADILEGLRRSIASWSSEDPAGGFHFVKSHTGFDGGPDGHWNLCVLITREYVRTAAQMQQFSSVLHAAMSALGRNYDACVLDYAERR